MPERLEFKSSSIDVYISVSVNLRSCLYVNIFYGFMLLDILIPLGNTRYFSSIITGLSSISDYDARKFQAIG